MRRIGVGILASCLACSSATEAPAIVSFDGIWQRIAAFPPGDPRPTGSYESLFDLRQYGDSVYGFFRQMVIQPPEATPVILAFTPVRGKVTGSRFEYSQFFITRWLPPVTVAMDGERIREVGNTETYARTSGPTRRGRPDLSRPFAWSVRADSVTLLPCRTLVDPTWSGTHGGSTMTFDTVARTVRIAELVGPCTAGRAPDRTLEVTRPYTIAHDMVIIQHEYRTSRYADTAVVTGQALQLYRREFSGQVTYPPIPYRRR
jgi:hypothetical protein